MTMYWLSTMSRILMQTSLCPMASACEIPSVYPLLVVTCEPELTPVASGPSDGGFAPAELGMAAE